MSALRTITVIKHFKSLHKPMINISKFPRMMCDKPVETTKETEKYKAPTVNDLTSGPIYYPTDFDKKILLWVGRYKKKEDIPKSMSFHTMDRARNKARIKFANIMMAMTLVGCLIMAISGKRASERGESVHQMNVDWHKSINEK